MAKSTMRIKQGVSSHTLDVTFLRQKETKIVEIEGCTETTSFQSRKRDMLRMLDSGRAVLLKRSIQVMKWKPGEEIGTRVTFLLRSETGKVKFVVIHRETQRRAKFHWKKVLPGSYGSAQ